MICFSMIEPCVTEDGTSNQTMEIQKKDAAEHIQRFQWEIDTSVITRDEAR